VPDRGIAACLIKKAWWFRAERPDRLSQTGHPGPIAALISAGKRPPPRGPQQIAVSIRVKGDAAAGIHHERSVNGAGGAGIECKAAAAAAEGFGRSIGPGKLQVGEQVADQEPGSPDAGWITLPFLPDPAQTSLLGPALSSSGAAIDATRSAPLGR